MGRRFCFSARVWPACGPAVGFYASRRCWRFRSSERPSLLRRFSREDATRPRWASVGGRAGGGRPRRPRSNASRTRCRPGTPWSVVTRRSGAPRCLDSRDEGTPRRSRCCVGRRGAATRTWPSPPRWFWTKSESAPNGRRVGRIPWRSGMKPFDVQGGPRGSAHDSPQRADVCLVLEGTYPYVQGGVSTWVHDLIGSLPDLRFALVHVGPARGAYTRMRYSLPANVVSLSNLYCREPPPARHRNADARRSSRVPRGTRRLHLEDEIDSSLLDDLASGDLSACALLHGRASFELPTQR